MTEQRYTPLRSLGVGALSEALLAHDAQGRQVVVKRLHRHCASDPSLVAMFEHEARVMATFDHPGLARLIESGRDAVGVFLAQEYIPGMTLRELFARSAEPLPLPAAIAVVAELLDALDHVHTRTDRAGTSLAIVHRDVCPANVLVTPRGAVALIDFGIATSAWRPDPERGQLKGTRGYMAPEVVTGERVADARSDLFAVGVILYELTTGRRLYDGPPLRVLHAIAEGPLPSPADVVPGYPSALHEVVQHALARSPEARFESARVMRDALTTATREHGIDASPEALVRVLSPRAGDLADDYAV